MRELKRQQHRQRREQAHAEALAAKKQSIMASPRPGAPPRWPACPPAEAAGWPRVDPAGRSDRHWRQRGEARCPPGLPSALPPAVLGRHRGAYQGQEGEGGTCGADGREGSPPLEYALGPQARCL